MVTKPHLRKNEETGRWEIYNPALEEADCYIALDNNKKFIVVQTAVEAEAFLKESGGHIFAINHYQHNDETLPQSILYKEVIASNVT